MKPCIIPLPKISDPRGNLSFIEEENHIPFQIRRIFWIYDVPEGNERGGHAHKNLWQVLIAINGSFDVVVDDGQGKSIFSLNRPDKGLLITPGYWREMINFSPGAVCLVIASEKYDRDDYIRDYSYFINWKNDTSFI